MLGSRGYHPFVEVLQVVRSSSAAIHDGFAHSDACVIHEINLGAIQEGPSGPRYSLFAKFQCTNPIKSTLSDTPKH